MAHRLERGERGLWNSLTVLKLSLQVLERRTELSSRQQKLVSAALGATERLSSTLVPAPTSTPRGLAPPNGHLPLAASDRPTRVLTRAFLPALLWRYAWPLGKRVVAGATRLLLTPRVVGLRARGGPKRAGHSSHR